MKKNLRPAEEQSAYEPDPLPAKLSKPAQRALAGAGITRLSHLSKMTEAELAKLHGMGPKAIGQLRAALAVTGKSFSNSEGVANVTDEMLIQELLDKWATATSFGRNDEILANHVPEVTIFDVLPPLKYEGAEAYRKSWGEWQPSTKGPVLFEIHELKITAGHNVAFAHGLIHCGGATPHGKTFEDWVRATFCLRKVQGKWLVTHQHISMPMKAGKS